MLSLSTELERYGAHRDWILQLEGSLHPRHLPYLDLCRKPTAERPQAVIELHGRPVLYIIQAARVVGIDHLKRLIRMLAFRGEGAYLGLLSPSNLEIFSLQLNDDAPAPRSFSAHDEEAASTIPTIGIHATESTERVHGILLRLLNDSVASIVRTGVEPESALSLVGRALFLRFLWDREIIGSQDVEGFTDRNPSIATTFSDAHSAARTSHWLDETFNGDLLPLPAGGSHKWFDSLSRSVYHDLSCIVAPTERSGQLVFEWHGIDFSVIPVGLLSQVYEHYAETFDERARETSIHYTPHHLASMLVDEVFSEIDDFGKIRVLDPAVGGGVFLVEVLRRLVTKRWETTGRRPTTKEIRSIIDSQLVGFDINSAALRLAALALYLTALELYPNRRPIKNLQFRPLMGRVLHNVSNRSLSNPVLADLGALTHPDAAKYQHSFDVVLGNPPWTAIALNRLPKDWDRQIRQTAAMRSISSPNYNPVPDGLPDIAFFWKAMEWCRPGGHIAFLMHARMLFKRDTKGGSQARDALFSGTRITGILNASSIKGTKVWPNVNAPYCMIFARNEQPHADYSFCYVSAIRDGSINKHGRFRLDEPTYVSVEALRRNPSLLKTLFRGGSLSPGVLQKLLKHTSLARYWSDLHLWHGEGYQEGGKAGTQHDASHLHGLPDVTKEAKVGLLVDTSELPLFQRETLLTPRRPEIYEAPVVLVKQSPGPDWAQGRALLLNKKAVYNRCYFGYSAAGHKRADELATILFVLLNSRIPMFYTLLTSSQFGVERAVLLKDDVDHLPIPPIAEFARDEVQTAFGLAESLVSGNPDWDAVDRWAGRVYGLNSRDLEVIADTLSTQLPYKPAMTRAEAPASREHIDLFCRRMAGIFRELLQNRARTVVVRFHASNSGWTTVWLSAESERVPIILFAEILERISDLSVSRVLLSVHEPSGLLLGQPSHYRHWTATSARMLAVDLVERLVRPFQGGL